MKRSREDELPNEEHKDEAEQMEKMRKVEGDTVAEQRQEEKTEESAIKEETIETPIENVPPVETKPPPEVKTDDTVVPTPASQVVSSFSAPNTITHASAQQIPNFGPAAFPMIPPIPSQPTTENVTSFPTPPNLAPSPPGISPSSTIAAQNLLSQQAMPPMNTGIIPGPTTMATSTPGIQITMNPTNTGPRQVKFENALDFLDQVKLQFVNQPKVYSQFLDIMKDFKAQCINTPGVIARVSELFKGHKSLILGFNTFLPPDYKIEYVPEEDTTKQPETYAGPSSFPPAQGVGGAKKMPEFDHARNYVKKIKMRFASQPHIYKAFLEILHTYHKEQHTIKEVYEQVANLFRNHQDLLDEFTRFLPDPMATAPPVSQPRGKKPPARKPKADRIKPPAQTTPATRKRERTSDDIAKIGTYEELNFFYKLKSRISQQQYYEFLKCINLYSQGIITRMELVLLVKDLLGRQRDIFDWFKNFIGYDDKAMDFIEKHDDRPVQTFSSLPEIDFKSCKRYGPSYRALPKNFVSPICSGRTPLCESVLNDTWVSVPTGSEDYGFKNMRKNQYEEMLFKCEDDRYELDLVIELNASTIRALEYVMRGIELGQEDNPRFRMDTNLTILHIRSIERIYGEKGADVVEAMYTHPASTVEVILKRLRQKDQEWGAARREWNKIWREVNEKNYYKSLDHQSFYFKQNDKKNLSQKVLLSEIKEMHQQQLKERELKMRRKRIQELEREKCADENEMEIDVSKMNGGKETSQEKQSELQEEKKVEEQPQPMEEDKPSETKEEDKPSEMEEVIEKEKDKEQATKEQKEKELTEKKEQEKAREREKELKDTEPKNYHLKYHMDDPSIMKDIIEHVLFYADRNFTKVEKEKIETFYNHFLKLFFFLGDEMSIESPEVKKEGDQTSSAGDQTSSAGDQTSSADPSDTEKAADMMQVESQPKEPSVPQPTEATVPQANESSVPEPNETSALEPNEPSVAQPSESSVPEPKEPSVPQESKAPTTEHGKRVFFGNTNFYVIFRLLQTLYERFGRAKTASKNSQSSKNFSYLLNPNKGHRGDRQEDRYKIFRQSLDALLAGAKDTGTYEDECRELFGIDAYVLFTLDKVLSQLAKHLQTTLSEELGSKLLAMYALETTSGKVNEELYRYHCSDLLNDARCFRLEFHKPSETFGGSYLTFTLMDPIRNPPIYVDINSDTHKKWADYVQSYAGTEETHVDPQKNRVFLNRALQDREKNQVLLENGLECRICIKTYRLFYLEGTEDKLWIRNRPHHLLTQNGKGRLEEILKEKFRDFTPEGNPFANG